MIKIKIIEPGWTVLFFMLWAIQIDSPDLCSPSKGNNLIKVLIQIDFRKFFQVYFIAGHTWYAL